MLIQLRKSCRTNFADYAEIWIQFRLRQNLLTHASPTKDSGEETGFFLYEDKSGNKRKDSKYFGTIGLKNFQIKS